MRESYKNLESKYIIFDSGLYNPFMSQTFDPKNNLFHHYLIFNFIFPNIC